MERGRTFYITLVSGLVALILLLISVNTPAQLVFESKPYARVVLGSGKLDGWTAAKLGLNSVQFNMVKNNYAEYLRRHMSADDSDSSDSDSEDEDDGEDNDGGKGNIHEAHLNHTGDGVTSLNGDQDNGATDDDRRDIGYTHVGPELDPEKTDGTVDSDEDESSSSSSSSSSDDDDDSSEEIPLEQKLLDKPFEQTVGLGLFHGKICQVMPNLKETCFSVSTNEAIFVMKHEVSFMQNDINMAMWNNLRVESLFSVIACILGLVFLLASLRPCCDNQRLPIYLGSLAFCGTGVLVVIPIVRLLLISTDFEQNLVTDLNVTTKLMMSWSLVASGIAAPFALMASFTLIATKWYKVSKKFYKQMKTKSGETIPNGEPVVEVKMCDLGKGTQYRCTDTQSDIYQNVEENWELLDEIQKENVKLKL